MTSTVNIKQDKLEITPLGAGNEVGRSAILVKFKGKQVLVIKLIKIKFDCGVQ
jgi:cleavage and polyadenylation specificity factor subunit 3